MTIIDTTLYANGALRLSRHGAGRGGTVLHLIETGEQLDIPDEIDKQVVTYVEADAHFGGRMAFKSAQLYVERYAARR